MNPSPPEPGDALSPDPRSSARRARRRTILGVVTLGAMLAVAFGAVAVRGQTPVDRATVASGHDIVVEVESLDTDLLSFADAWTRVDDANRPFVAVVLGDSTGNAPGEWVDLAFRALSERLDRPLIEHPWNLESARYGDPVTTNADSDAAPIIVWNGSASGKTAEYSLRYYDALVPQQPDVLLLNHGLNNVRDPEAVGGQFSDVLTRTEQTWPRTVGYAALLENPRFDDWAAAHDAVLSRVASWLDDRPFVLGIDVHSAYLAESDPLSFLTADLLHPSPSGSQLTADTVLDAISRATGDTSTADERPADERPAEGSTDASTDAGPTPAD